MGGKRSSTGDLTLKSWVTSQLLVQLNDFVGFFYCRLKVIDFHKDDRNHAITCSANPTKYSYHKQSQNPLLNASFTTYPLYMKDTKDSERSYLWVVKPESLIIIEESKCIVNYIGGKFTSGELVMLRKNSCCHGVLKNHMQCGNCEINE